MKDKRPEDNKDEKEVSSGFNPDSNLFQELESGILRASAIGANVRGRVGTWLSAGRHTLIGRPLATSEESQQRLSKFLALPILASDNISSSAYATEEIARVLVVAGLGALSLTLPITFALVGVLAVVVLSYSQVVRAYPMGGGSYSAAKENLGTLAGLVAAASLLLDYVLTVAVSVTAGIAALTSIFPGLYPMRIWFDLVVVLFLVVGNLRGVRESGAIFSLPTYCYVLSLAGLLGYGFYRYATGTLPAYTPPPQWVPTTTTEALGWVLVLRAFSSGAVALTGIEAVSNSMRVVKAPEVRNANIVLVWMGILFASLFVGVSLLAAHIGLVPDPSEEETLISQLARLLAGNGWLHVAVQLATAMILLLAANTAFVGFPRLSSVLATDRFFPNQFQRRGDRLALSTGIIAVGVLAAAFIMAFHGSVAALIPLYTIGVFVAFTLSQAGMVRHWRKARSKGWRLASCANLMGMVVTGFIAVEALFVKFTHGAWIVLILIPLLVLLMLAIRGHYTRLSQELRFGASALPKVAKTSLVVVPVADLTTPVAWALAYARGLGTELQAVHVTDVQESVQRLRQRWALFENDIPLVVIEAPYRNWTEALIQYLDSMAKQRPNELLTVVIPEFIPRHWWEQILHAQSALRIKMALLSHPQIVVIDVPFQMKR